MAKSKKVKADIKMSLDQYFKKVQPKIHKYTRAFIEPQFSGKLKTEVEWQEELKQYLMEGE